MTQQQRIFKVIVLHNKLLAEDELNALMAQTPDPEDIVAKLVIGEIVSDTVGDKLLALYHHNLRKQGISGDMAAVGGATVSSPATQGHADDHGHPHDLHPKSEATRIKEVFGNPAPSVAGSAPAVTRAPVAPVKAAEAPRQEPPRAAAISVAVQPSSIPTDLSAPIPVNIRMDENDDRHLAFDLLGAARRLGASDLHLKSGAVPVVRIATHLRVLDVPVLPPNRVERALKAILTEKDRGEFEKHNDLDCSFDGGAELGRFRLNMLRQHHGVDGTFRLIPDKVPSFDDLKLPRQCRKFTEFRQGVVLVTGPKGSGKTTTLAALIDLINTKRADHIITIEDPIEFVHPSKKGHVNQREVGVHTNSFANALRASLREAPDVIMVGEMRDLETVSLAITAAETGHLVFGTLHTPDAQRTINRVIDVFPPGEQGQIRAMFSESLRGVISQFLVAGMDGRSVHLATEVMFNTGAIANLIRENRAFQLHGIMQTHRKQGMHLMDESLARLVKEHKISREEAMARSENSSQMEKELAALG